MAANEIVVDGVVYVPKAGPASNRVIVRCRNAGVHVGTLVHRDAVNTVLERANRLWRWSTPKGNGDISDIATYGVVRNKRTRISPEVARLTLTTSDTCEIVPVPDWNDLSEVRNE